ncbi:MAG: nucleotidyltransferase [Candidatus Auribacterota bacterium]|nr:nucleotidyltransferase [Candidatus Auribacterota bacterium]
MNFEGVFELLLESFNKGKVNFALIGGFAVAASGYPRTTVDIDFLVAGEDMAKVKHIMLSSGYDLIHESEDVSNFLGQMKELGNVDFLHAHRKYARAMLIRARNKKILGGKFISKVVTPEDVIGLKIQSSSNDPKRYHQDMADIEAIIKANHPNLDMELLKEYFELFNRGDELKQILEKLSCDD